jgi:hypothetical protein
MLPLHCFAVTSLLLLPLLLLLLLQLLWVVLLLLLLLRPQMLRQRAIDLLASAGDVDLHELAREEPEGAEYLGCVVRLFICMRMHCMDVRMCVRVFPTSTLPPSATLSLALRRVAGPF